MAAHLQSAEDSSSPCANVNTALSWLVEYTITVEVRQGTLEGHQKDFLLFALSLAPQ